MNCHKCNIERGRYGVKEKKRYIEQHVSQDMQVLCNLDNKKLLSECALFEPIIEYELRVSKFIAGVLHKWQCRGIKT